MARLKDFIYSNNFDLITRYKKKIIWWIDHNYLITYDSKHLLTGVTSWQDGKNLLSDVTS